MVRLSCSDKTERHDPLQGKPSIHLPLEKALRRHDTVSCRSFSPSPQSSKPAYTRGDQTYPRYETPESSHWAGSLLGQAEAKRLYTLYLRFRKRGQMAVKLPNPKRKSKPYEQMQYPGQRVQIDVKFVPQSCIAGQEKGTQYYQYTFIDEYSRFRYLEAFEEHNTYSSTLFLLHVVKKFPFLIECVQTDNGTEFTNRLLAKGSERLTLFEQTLQKLGIRHKLIRPYTPRHNGKVERSHRKDNEEFYALHSFYSFDDFKKQLAVRERAYNNFPMRPLNWRSPKQVLDSFSSV